MKMEIYIGYIANSVADYRNMAINFKKIRLNSGSMKLNFAKYPHDSAKKMLYPAKFPPNSAKINDNSANWKLFRIFTSNLVHILVKKLPSSFEFRVLYFKYVKNCTYLVNSTIG